MVHVACAHAAACLLGCAAAAACRVTVASLRPCARGLMDSVCVGLAVRLCLAC